MSMFAKRHYEAIAAVMKNAHPGAMGVENRAVMQWSETCKDLAEMFERDNPRFDIIRFMKACKPYYKTSGTIDIDAEDTPCSA
jgi:hypothetical protein